jgi:hypothetical protein
MKIDVKTINIETEGIMSEAFFSVKEKNMAHIFSILRNSLYSDKPLAIIREYCTNAQDAHVEAGKPNESIRVKYPTIFDNTLSIRDFGNGLSNEDVFTVFNSYGESTKRDSNDLVGMLGLGSKSAFSYVNDFTIKSYNNGLMSHYIAYIDETNIGKVSLVNTEATDETGLEIIISILPHHVRSFNSTFTEYLCKFEPTPIVINDAYFDSSVKSSKRNLVIEHDDWGILHDNNNQSIIRMGNVDYVFTYDSLKLTTEESADLKCFDSRRFSVYLKAKIGDVVPSASRESLEMNSKTLDYIKKQLYKIKNSIKGLLEEKVNNYDSLYEFLLNYRTLRLLNIMFGIPIVYRGKTVNCNASPVLDLKDFNATKHKSITKWSRNLLEDTDYVDVNPKQTALYYSRKSIPASTVRKRINKFLESSQNENLRHNNLFVLEFETPSLANEFVSNPDYTLLNKVNLADIVLDRDTASGTRSVLDKTEFYQYVGGNAVQDCWKPVRHSLDDGGIYVPIKYYQPIVETPKGLVIDTMGTFKVMREYLSRLGFDKPIYGVRTSDVKNLDDSWVNLGEYIQEWLHTMDETLKQKVFTSCITNHRTNCWSDLFNCGLFDGDENFSRLKELIKKYVYRYTNSDYSNSIVYLRGLGYRFPIPEQEEIHGWMEHLSREHPILRVMSGEFDNFSRGAVDIANSYIMRK